MIKQKVLAALEEKDIKEIHLLTPKNSAHGDYAFHVKSIGRDVESIDFKDELFSNVERVGDFINLTISPIALIAELTLILEQKEGYGSIDLLKGKKLLVEFAHPNTHKLFHIGHLRNISTGESLARILIANGAEVKRINYQGDVGLHIAKCLYSMLRKRDEMNRLSTLDEKIAFLGKCYTEGNTAYETDESAKEDIQMINKQIFEHDPQVKPLWEQTRQWSLDYFDRIYKRVGTKFERLYFESEVAKPGLKIAQEALKKGILSESDGAVIFDGQDSNIDTRVFINSKGLPTYEAKELGLAELEFSEFGLIDKCIHVVGPEQKSFFKTTFKVEELLDPEKYRGKQFHFAYGFVDLKDGKMSSRKGNVLTGEWLLNEVKDNVIKSFSTDDLAADTISVGAIKYAFLRVEPPKKITFDIEESISLRGNSGPYLQYAYARCQSILKKSENDQFQLISTNFNQFKPEELALLRTLFRFPEVIEDAARHYAPHLIATYLFDLAQKFNLFYEKHQILKAEEDIKQFRLALTAATAQLLKNGLYLLGIEVLDKI